jgi:Rrf2 family protein
MSQTNVQFSVASHVMASLGFNYGESIRSTALASSVNADSSFVRRVVSKLSKAGLVTTTRGKNGACSLSRPPSQITLLDIYLASQAPAAFAVHGYAVTEDCRVSRNIKRCMEDVLREAQAGFEKSLAQQTLQEIVDKIKKGK